MKPRKFIKKLVKWKSKENRIDSVSSEDTVAKRNTKSKTFILIIVILCLFLGITAGFYYYNLHPTSTDTKTYLQDEYNFSKIVSYKGDTYIASYENSCSISKINEDNSSEIVFQLEENQNLKFIDKFVIIDDNIYYTFRNYITSTSGIGETSLYDSSNFKVITEFSLYDAIEDFCYLNGMIYFSQSLYSNEYCYDLNSCTLDGKIDTIYKVSSSEYSYGKVGIISNGQNVYFYITDKLYQVQSGDQPEVVAQINKVGEESKTSSIHTQKPLFNYNNEIYIVNNNIVYQYIGENTLEQICDFKQFPENLCCYINRDFLLLNKVLNDEPILDFTEINFHDDSTFELFNETIDIEQFELEDCLGELLDLEIVENKIYLQYELFTHINVTELIYVADLDGKNLNLISHYSYMYPNEVKEAY